MVRGIQVLCIALVMSFLCEGTGNALLSICGMKKKGYAAPYGMAFLFAMLEIVYIPATCLHLSSEYCAVMTSAVLLVAAAATVRYFKESISSYLESLVLEQYLGVYSISTAKIFELASAKGMDFKVFPSQNENEVDSLEISNESKAEIHEAISKGQKIIIPAENISVGSWSGTGYIIMGDDEYSFMISNGSHGGYTVTDLSVYYSINVVIAGDAMFYVLYGMISASVTMFMTGNFIGGAVMLGISITLTYMLMDFICDCTDLYFDVLDGNEAAANQLNLNAFISTAGFLSQPLVEPLAEGLASVKVPECVSNAVNAGNDWILGNSETYRRFVMMGYSDELVAGLFQDARCFFYGDDFIENVLKSGDAHEIMSTLANCPDEIISVVSSSTMKDALPSFISNYGDDATRILLNYGDDALTITEQFGSDAISNYNYMDSISTRYSNSSMNYQYLNGDYVPREVTPENYTLLDEQAEEMYSNYRLMTDDIEKISNNTGWSMDDVSTVKNHAFNKQVLLDDGYSHFPADYEMAVAWQRLIEGNFYESDILLLKHKLYESIYYDMYYD